ncbi:MAG: protein translocase subunit SecD [Lachnospiraceae bacterium]|jgi:SecD/SecF fusion protein|nr:protein translocase subunit SecD [Lachnospiraceae bacterium]MCI9134386.1 protein translocase subunit SecD [Lachnospiraceae bacterium]
MKKSRGVLVLLITLVITAGLIYTAAVGIGAEKSGAVENVKLGLDLAGGVSITYGTVIDNPTAEQMSDTIYKLQKRVENYSTEAQVYQEGDNRINIEIPGVQDANAVLEELGRPGSLEFQDPNGNVILTGLDIADAKAVSARDQMGNVDYAVSLSLTDEGAQKFAKATEENIGRAIPIIYDGQVVSAPTVQSAIGNGQAQINHMESFEAAELLASTIRIGSLQLELTELRSNVVGAQLGQDAISSSLKAGAVGFGLVVVFMIVFYLVPGLAAGLALTIYVALMLLLLGGFEITLTLPGIAGIILSIGMAVDANVIIFARIREELATGKTVRSAMKIGFQKALSAIVDGNITTLIVAVVLLLKASGSVKGFAQTLALGIVLSMFTALFVTRQILYAFYALGLKDPKFFGVQKERKVIHFLAKRKLFFGISIAAVVIGFVAMGIQAGMGNGALAYSLEFQGGTSTTVPFQQELSIEDIESQVKPVVAEATGDQEIQAQKVQGSNDVIIKTKELSLDQRQALNQALAEKFSLDAAQISAESISSTISDEVRMDATVAVIIGIICMLLYIWFRFKDIRFAGSAVTALVHDVLVVLTFYALVRISVGNTFIACMLTIVGYSINATIVIFDRIRENMSAMKKKDDLQDLVDLSITQTLSRSINTSLTTFIMVAVLFVMGVASIRDFALPLMAGIVCGAYSSVCITGALWYWMKKNFKEKTA